MPATSLDQVVNLARRRGFIFPGSEIYGGLANTWDYGPYGVELKNNLKQFWWKYWVTNRDDIVGLDAAILMNPKTWEASGHISNFSDPLVDCKECKKRFRGDKLLEEFLKVEWNTFYTLALKYVHEKDESLLNEYKENFKKIGISSEKIKVLLEKLRGATGTISTDSFSSIGNSLRLLEVSCPDCGANKLNWSDARNFNLMFKTQQGVTEEDSREIFLRPETAQGIFVNFKNVLNATRKRLPFGIAQIGKAFRNEITPGQFTFRTREFEQMEIEYFCAEKDWKKTFAELEKASSDFFAQLGIEKQNLRWREHEKDELSHYSKLTKDVEFKFPWGWGELMGLAYRTDFDLAQHQKVSGESLEYLDTTTNKKFIPHCIEPSFGCDRTVLTILIDAYTEDEIGGEKRTLLKLAPELAPIKVAVLPLSKKPQLTKVARKVNDTLRAEFRTEYDETQSIGKRYRRQDEIGTPLCVTVDFGTIGEDDGQSKKDHVTVRERDSLKQTEVPLKKLAEFLRDKLKS